MATSATGASEPSPPATPRTSASTERATAIGSSPSRRTCGSTPRFRAASASCSALGVSSPARVSIFRAMSERGLHRIEDDLHETWLEDWAGAGVAEIETYLAKYAAFHAFLESQDA